MLEKESVKDEPKIAMKPKMDSLAEKIAKKALEKTVIKIKSFEPKIKTFNENPATFYKLDIDEVDDSSVVTPMGNFELKME